MEKLLPLFVSSKLLFSNNALGLPVRRREWILTIKTTHDGNPFMELSLAPVQRKTFGSIWINFILIRQKH